MHASQRVYVAERHIVKARSEVAFSIAWQVAASDWIFDCSSELAKTSREEAGISCHNDALYLFSIL